MVVKLGFIYYKEDFKKFLHVMGYIMKEKRNKNKE